MSSSDQTDDDLTNDKNSRPQVRRLNVETPKERFSRDEYPPESSAWRSNLAACSQRRNLLFVAYVSEIYVFIPAGHLQLLRHQPEMIISPVMKDPYAEGLLDTENPHAINHLLVDELGQDEILLLATDSGNVCAYYVEAIYSSITRHADKGAKRPFDTSEVKPFFCEDVYMSVWGLATHKYARLIAVSANTQVVTVFAFALETPKGGVTPSTDPNLDDPDQPWINIDNNHNLQRLQKMMPNNHRSRNLRLSYKGHYDNIPCVSFANFDLDANAEWLVSTDIANRVVIWRIWEDLFPIRVYYPGHPQNNPPERGWAVLPLDPRTFRSLKFAEQACGGDPESKVISGRTILDLSEAVPQIGDTARYFKTGNRNPESPEYYTLPDDLISESTEVFKPAQNIDLSETVNYAVLRASFDSPEAGADIVLEDDDAEDEEMEDDDADMENEESENEDPGEDDIENEDLVSSSKLPQGTRDRPRLQSLFEDDNADFPESRYMDNNRHRQFARYPKKSYRQQPGSGLRLLRTKSIHPSSPSCFPILHFSEHHISMAPYPMDSNYQLLCTNALAQQAAPYEAANTHRAFAILSNCDRLNMIKYLPEAGIVVAASQKGRVAILSLTWQEEVGFAFRTDWILPFKSQEYDNERPLVPLLGMAVSPMPGFENPPDILHIPQGIDPDDWISFNYRDMHSDDTSSSKSSSNTSNPQPQPGQPTESMDQDVPMIPPIMPSGSNQSEIEHLFDLFDNTLLRLCELERTHPSRQQRETGVDENQPNSYWDLILDPVPNLPNHGYSLAELHAQASAAHHPPEPWHGTHPSRHYRILLLFSDHTVMSYEFWQGWKRFPDSPSAGSSQGP
ncbi:hypothetical protein N7490_011560 [Penicillium lividum]|nr:hypothetical protein N7490_011560 [Penicillium lividum]